MMIKILAREKKFMTLESTKRKSMGEKLWFLAKFLGITRIRITRVRISDFQELYQQLL